MVIGKCWVFRREHLRLKPGGICFFADLVAGSLSGVRLATSDAHSGLVDAIAANLPGTTWERWRTHYAANLRSVTPKTNQPAANPMMHSVYDRADRDSVRAQFHRLLDFVEDEPPAVTAHLDEARDDILAFGDFRGDVWQQIWTNSPNERLNREIRRRPDSLGIFPNPDAIIHLVGAVLAEQNDEWAEGHRYFGHDILARCPLNPLDPDADQEDTGIPARRLTPPTQLNREPVTPIKGLNLYLVPERQAAPRNFPHRTGDIYLGPTQSSPSIPTARGTPRDAVLCPVFP